LDEPRLEYAAACEAKDPSYAAYIRHEIERARPESGVWRPGNEQVEKRIAHPFLEDCYDVQLYRGFVEEVTMDPNVFIERGDRLLDRAPIRKITFTPKPLPMGLEMPLIPQRVPSLVPEIMACPHLARVYSIAFRDTNFQCWFTDVPDIESILASPYLDRLLTFKLASERFPAQLDDGYLPSVWARAFDRPEFRKMIAVGFFGYPGERSRSYEDGWIRVTEATPMPEEGRALERKHGYLPTLHAANVWGNHESQRLFNNELVLEVLRGRLPKFPVGAPVTEEMYALPPAKRRTLGNDW
jgi:hypothetical protein